MQNKWGQTIAPEMVLSETKPGRRVLLLGNCTDASHLASLVPGSKADIIVTGALMPKSKAGAQAGAQANGAGGAAVQPGEEVWSAEGVGKLADALQAQQVLIGRFDTQVHGGAADPATDPLVSELVADVQGACPRAEVLPLEDFWVHVFEKHEGSAPPLPAAASSE